MRVKFEIIEIGDENCTVATPNEEKLTTVAFRFDEVVFTTVLGAVLF